MGVRQEEGHIRRGRRAPPPADSSARALRPAVAPRREQDQWERKRRPRQRRERRLEKGQAGDEGALRFSEGAGGGDQRVDRLDPGAGREAEEAEAGEGRTKVRFFFIIFIEVAHCVTLKLKKKIFLFSPCLIVKTFFSLLLSFFYLFLFLKTNKRKKNEREKTKKREAELFFIPLLYNLKRGLEKKKEARGKRKKNMRKKKEKKSTFCLHGPLEPGRNTQIVLREGFSGTTHPPICALIVRRAVAELPEGAERRRRHGPRARGDGSEERGLEDLVWVVELLLEQEVAEFRVAVAHGTVRLREGAQEVEPPVRPARVLLLFF